MTEMQRNNRIQKSTMAKKFPPNHDGDHMTDNAIKASSAWKNKQQYEVALVGH